MIILFTLLAVRWLYRFINATLWAEDGALFLSQAFQFGYKSLGMPYAGYFHTLPRIIAYFASFLPSLFVSHFIILSCFVFTYYTISKIFSDDYEWIIPKIYYRGLLAVLLVLVPGTQEAYGNIANLHWVLYMYLAVLGLKRPDSKFTIPEICITALAVLSEGATLTLLPLYCMRLVFQFLRKRGIYFYIQEMLMVVFILLLGVINFSIREQSTVNVNLIFLLKIYIKTTVCEFLSYPWLYSTLYKVQSKYWIVPGFYLSAFTIFWLVKRPRKEDFWIPVFFFGSVLLYPVMIGVVRPGSAFSEGSWWLFMRYGFPAGFSGYIFWVWFLSGLRLKNASFVNFVFVYLTLMSFVFSLHSGFFIQPAKQTNYFFIHSSEIDNVRTNKESKQIVIPIEPKDWAMSIGSGQTKILINPNTADRR
jgi:hypothetical protein